MNFWIVVVGLTAVLVLVLAILGPPQHDAGSDALTSNADNTMIGRRSSSGPIADPDPTLLSSISGVGGAGLPIVSGDGRTPMATYAAPYNNSLRRPKVAILVAGIGLSEIDSMPAIRMLPPPVTLAISPYGRALMPLLAAARQTQHEYLLSIPMRPAAFPIADPDDQNALMTSLSPAQNLVRLHLVMSKIAGYVGVTDVMGVVQGEGFSSNDNTASLILDDLAQRGLLFVGGTTDPTSPRHVWGYRADLLIDAEPFNSAILETRLERLNAIARTTGSALGVVTVPRAVTLQRIVTWAKQLPESGIVLAPVTAIVQPPRKAEMQ